MKCDVIFQPQNLALYGQGILTTLHLLFASLAIGAVLALAFALALTSRWRVLRAVVGARCARSPRAARRVRAVVGITCVICAVVSVSFGVGTRLRRRRERRHQWRERRLVEHGALKRELEQRS